ncbi:MAG: general secretion pathway protein GspI [Beijerinckiaceae bacterium]|nr:general secretion pathway protein GspI [Beijerinckiaceae bacterium]MCI0736101.1 general secretion pathway protein GspI [Beijerinckiaceae bacterium]
MPFERSTGNASISAGFTLIEALVALAVTAASLSAIALLMAGNVRGTGRIAQHLGLIASLRTVETGLSNRAALALGNLSGEMYGQAWSVAVAPFSNEFVNPRAAALWTPQLIVMTVQSPTGALLQLETVRLARRSGVR